MPHTLEFRNHIARTYRNLRLGIVGIAILLPCVLVAWSSFISGSFEPEPSISSYYHSSDPYLRDIFVGSLCATGVFLVLYRGFKLLENLLLDLAGVCVICVALVPLTLDQAPQKPLASTSIAEGNENQNTTGEQQPVSAEQPTGFEFTRHGAFAIGFFLAIALVVLTQANRSLSETIATDKRARYNRTYKILGILMVVLPLGAWAYLAYVKRDWGILALETLAIWVFAAYWCIKTVEFWGTAGIPEAKLLGCLGETNDPDS